MYFCRMKFSDIPGQETVKTALRRMVGQHRLPHALLLSGPEGIGKLAMARAFAAYLHCASPTPEGDSCGHCGPCRQHAALNFPDIVYSFPTAGSRNSRTLTCEDLSGQWRTFLDEDPLASWPGWVALTGAENAQPAIRVADSEIILRHLSRSNYGASTRVVLMWLPEKLTQEAANKLLKVIEEPAEGQMFIMVSNNPQLILPTIGSRLQRLVMHPLSCEDLSRWLAGRYGLDSETVRETALISEGIPARAVGIMDTRDETREFSDLFRRLMRLAYSRRVGDLKRWSETVADLRREKIIRFLTYCSRQIRVNLLYGCAGAGSVALSADDSDFVSKFAPYINPANAELFKTEFEQAVRDVAGNANARIVLFDMALQCILHIRTS